jgi:hypothetical protein
MKMIELQIAVTAMKDRVHKEGTLADRVLSAMRYVRKHEPDLFWMSYKVTDDDMLRTALASVMADATEMENDVIERSLMPVRMLGAAASGIPVDFSAMRLDDDLLPLIKLWQESEK